MNLCLLFHFFLPLSYRISRYRLVNDTGFSFSASFLDKKPGSYAPWLSLSVNVKSVAQDLFTFRIHDKGYL